MDSVIRPLKNVTIVAVCLVLTGCGHIPRMAVRQRLESRKLHSGEAADIQFALGRSHESEGEFDKAMIAYREAARRDHKRADAPLRVAILLDRFGRFSESAPYYEDALKASPGNPEIFCDRGYSLALQGRDLEAATAYRQAIATNPDLARAHNNLGVLLGRTGQQDEALAEFRKAGCPEPDAQLNLAFALSMNHQWEEAKQHVQIAHKLGAKSLEVALSVTEMNRIIALAENTPASSPVTDLALLKASVNNGQASTIKGRGK